MSRTKPWEVSDKLWARVEPLLPERERDPHRQYRRKPGAGRPPADPRKVFAAIVRVLRTGCQWNTIEKERDGVASSSVHRRFQEWTKAGFFLELWRNGLAEYDEFEGIAWEWQSIDATQLKAPLAQEAVGANPTDRGKKRDQDNRPCRRRWGPSLCVHNRREHPRGDANRTRAPGQGGASAPRR